VRAPALVPEDHPGAVSQSHGRRRSIRLSGYDYTQAGAYFLTICSRDRQCIFADIREGASRPTPVGELIAACWNAIPNHFPAAEMDAFVVMPNHLHGIVVLGADPTSGPGTACRAPTAGGGADHARKPTIERFGAPVPGSIPTVVRSFKAAVTKTINDDPGRGTACRALLSDGLGPIPPGRIPSIWQSNYHEHIIRNARALDRLRTYIETNPARWLEDSLHPDNATFAKSPFGRPR
jgi:putative transposase